METLTWSTVEEAIRAADRAITAEDFDALMEFYTDDAMLVVKPGVFARGKEQIRRAFVGIAEHFRHKLVVRQGRMEVLTAGNSALAVMETVLDIGADGGTPAGRVTRRATYVFNLVKGSWLCSIDNSYGSALLDAPGQPESDCS